MDDFSHSWKLKMGKKAVLLSINNTLFNPLTVSFFLALALILLVSLTGGKSRSLVPPENFNEGGKSAKSTCEFWTGMWVFDNVSYPLYSEGGCSFMSDQLACGKFGRKNLRYQNWRWQPDGCDLPRFNGTALGERLRGKRLVFVGDSLNRGQWVSMVCLLHSSNPNAHNSIHTNGSLITFHLLEYNARIDFYWAPLLVESNSDDPVKHKLAERIVRVESITKHARHWMDADILVFNSYLWWRRATIKVMWGDFEGKDGIYKDMETLRSFEMALRTWSDWLEAHVEPTKTQLFFVSLSPTHFWGEEWGMGKEENCYEETGPIRTKGYWGRGSDKKMMSAVDNALERLKGRGLHVRLLNITQLSEYRKDAHPSIYRKQWDPLTQDQISNPRSYADCIHWCLPGVPDVWNQILYAYIFS